MMAVEDLLRAYASAYDAWLDPEVERENPTHEYAELIRQTVNSENNKLRELVCDIEPFLCCMPFANCNTLAADARKRMTELGIEV